GSAACGSPCSIAERMRVTSDMKRKNTARVQQSQHAGGASPCLADQSPGRHHDASTATCATTQSRSGQKVQILKQRHVDQILKEPTWLGVDTLFRRPESPPSVPPFVVAPSDGSTN